MQLVRTTCKDKKKMFFNEGLNDRFAETFQANKNISSDIVVDEKLNSTPLNRIWLGTDYHLFKYNKETKEIFKNPDFDIILNNQNKYVGEDDVFIFLGDLADDECQMNDEIANICRSRLLGGYKILILGNNELQSEGYYLNECGFDQVFYAYQWSKFTFSHIPLRKFDTQVNIHGHLHEHKLDGYLYDGIPYQTSYIKIYTKENNNKPISLEEVIKKYNQGYYNYSEIKR